MKIKWSVIVMDGFFYLHVSDFVLIAICFLDVMLTYYS